MRFFFVTLTACYALPLAAQAPRDSAIGVALSRFRPSHAIQVASLQSRWTGRYAHTGGDTLYIASRGQSPLAIPFIAIDTLWRQEDRFARGAVIGGTTLGVIGGLGMVVLAGLGGAEGGSSVDNGKLIGLGLASGAALGLVGALTGGWIGSAFNRWIVVYP